MSLSGTFYNCFLNPVMRRLLRSPLHGLVSRDIAILHFTGRKSGRALNTPLSYVKDGRKVLFLSSQNTGWWKNFRGGESPVGTAVLMEGDSEALRDGVRRFLSALPRDAIVYGIKLDKSKRPTESSLAKAAHRLVVVEVALD